MTAGKTPIEMMLNGLTWVAVTPQPRDFGTHGADDGIPYATHEGEMDFMGHKLRCYRLSDGKAVINADDLEAFFEEFMGPPDITPEQAAAAMNDISGITDALKGSRSD